MKTEPKKPAAETTETATITVLASVHAAAKIACALDGKTIQEIATDALRDRITEIFKKHNFKPV